MFWEDEIWKCTLSWGVHRTYLAFVIKSWIVVWNKCSKCNDYIKHNLISFFKHIQYLQGITELPCVRNAQSCNVAHLKYLEKKWLLKLNHMKKRLLIKSKSYTIL